MRLVKAPQLSKVAGGCFSLFIGSHGRPQTQKGGQVILPLDHGYRASGDFVALSVVPRHMLGSMCLEDLQGAMDGICHSGLGSFAIHVGLHAKYSG